MGDAASTVDIKLVTTADTSGVQQTRDQYEDLFNDLKKGVADALSAQGVDPKFISHVVDEFDRLNRELQETGASGDVVVEKIAKLQASLTAAAAAEEKRVRQLKVNFEMALHEKDVQEEAAANQRRRREEDQLAMEAEGRELKKNTELLEAEIMARLKAERATKEAASNTQALGGAMKGVQRDIGGAAMQAAYFVDDMQYGIRGILNNIPQLVMALGMGGGLAGIISIAAVAVNFLWEKFGGAHQAKEEVEKVNESLSAMHRALDDVKKAADDAFQKDLKKYSAEVDSVCEAWKRGVEDIKRIVGYHNELAAVQTKIANHKLEIDRQNALAGASTDDERKTINTKFDARKAAVNNASDIEQAKRNLDAEKVNSEELRRQFSNVSGRKDDAEGRINAGDEIVKRIGWTSDQGRAVSEDEKARKKIEELQQKVRELEEEDKALSPYSSPEASDARNDLIVEEKAKLEAATKDRNLKSAGVKEAKERLASGDGLTFEGDKERAKEQQQKDPEGAAAALRTAQRREQEAAQVTGTRKAAEEALTKYTAELAKIREAEARHEEQMLLRRKELELAEIKDSEDFAKAGAAKVIADKEADEKTRKQQMEEQARKLENDAQAAEQRGDTKGAEEARRKAAEYKLPDNATPEQKRKVALDQAAQREKDKPKTVSAGGVTDPLSNLAANLGPAGKALGDAVNKLKDGATGKEIEAVLSHLTELTPLITRQYAESATTKKKLADVEKQLAELKLQLRSTQI